MYNFINITKSEIADFCTGQDYCAKITDMPLDISAAATIVDTHSSLFIDKDHIVGYQSLGLQFSATDNDQYTGSSESIRYVDENHTVVINTSNFKLWSYWNDIGQQLAFLKDDIGLALYRTRLLLTKGNLRYQSVNHIDYDWRYVVPITTNSACILTYVDGTELHLPADGSAYIFNAGFVHSYKNFGTTDRCHYIGILDIPNAGDGVVSL